MFKSEVSSFAKKTIRGKETLVYEGLEIKKDGQHLKEYVDGSGNRGWTLTNN